MTGPAHGACVSFLNRPFIFRPLREEGRHRCGGVDAQLQEGPQHVGQLLTRGVAAARQVALQERARAGGDLENVWRTEQELEEEHARAPHVVSARGNNQVFALVITQCQTIGYLRWL